MPKLVQKRLDEGRAVYDLGVGPKGPEAAAEAQGTPKPPDRPASDGMPVPARLPQPVGPGPSDVLDGPQPEDLEEFYDDVSGEALPPSLTREARMEEVRFMQGWQGWEVRTIKECKEVAGNAPIGAGGLTTTRGCREPQAPV